jgi:hypothetical protein
VALVLVQPQVAMVQMLVQQAVMVLVVVAVALQFGQ